MRDDFPLDVKRILAARVGNLCSNPECRALTSGPQDDPSKALNVGVAAHITGAALGGPRYNPSLSSEQRCHAENGIWLCQNCAKLVDNDVSQFPVEILRAWKTLAEHHARFAIGRTPSSQRAETDSERKMRRILDRKGKVVTLSEMTPARSVIMLGPRISSCFVTVLDCNLDYVTVRGGSSQMWERSIPLENISIAFDHERNQLELQQRHE